MVLPSLLPVLYSSFPVILIHSNCIYSITCSIVLLLYCFQSTFSYNGNVFHFTCVAVWFVFGCVPWTYLLFLVLHCVFFSLCRLTVFWIPKCSACSLEGEQLLIFWSDPDLVHNYKNPSCCAVLYPHAEAHVVEILQACWFSGIQPQLRDRAPYFVTHHREKINLQDA